MAMQQTFAFLDAAESAPVVTARPTKPEPTKAQPTKAPSPTIRGAIKSPVQQVVRQVAQPATRDDILRRLRVQARCITTTGEDASVQKPSVPTFSTGSPDIDSMLPRGGLAVAAVTEWVAASEGTPAGAIALVAAAKQLARHPGPLVVVARPDDFYPPAAIGLGIAAARIVWVRPSCHADAVWSIDQSLRCDAVAAVWSIVGAQLDDRDARRFQLASETGQTPGLFVRPIAVRGRPTFADTRFHVGLQPTAAATAQPTLQITLDRCRGAAGGASTTVQIDDRGQLISSQLISSQPISSQLTRIEPTRIEPIRTPDHETAAVRLAAQLAHPKTAKRNGQQPDRRRRA